MKTQYDDWTIDDLSMEDIKAGKFPNWARAGYQSKSQAIDAILEMMHKREPIFAALGLQPGQITKKRKNKGA